MKKKVIYGYVNIKNDINYIFGWHRIMPGCAGTLEMIRGSIVEDLNQVTPSKKIKITIEEVGGK